MQRQREAFDMTRIFRFAFIVMAMLTMSVGPVRGQVTDSVNACPKVGLVLSGGGAMGAAHIGVLKYLEEIGIPVSYVAGTSMGSIIGGLYTLGYSADELKELISAIDWPTYISNRLDRVYLSQRRRKMDDRLLFNVPFGKVLIDDELLKSALPTGAVEGDNLMNLFSNLSVGYQDSMCFDSMPIPFACVATDLMTGKEIVLKSDEFAKAIRSSMAIPVIFTPVQKDTMMLADGGITNNFPVDVCLGMGADVVIGVQVAAGLSNNPNDMRSIPLQLQQYISIFTNRSIDEHRDQCRIYIKPDVSGTNMMSFNADAIADLILRGYEAAKAKKEDFLRLKAELCNDAEPRSQKARAIALHEYDTIWIDTITTSGNDDDGHEYLMQASSPLLNHPVTLKEVEDVVHFMQGTGMFHSVNYKASFIQNSDGYNHYRLEFKTTPELSNRIGLGMRFDSEESATMLTHFSWNALQLSGFNAWLELGLNYNPWLKSHVGWVVNGRDDLGIDLKLHTATLTCHNLGVSSYIIRENKLRIGYTMVHLPHVEFSAGISQEFNRQFIDTVSYTSLESATGLYVKSTIDTKDNNSFATKGFLMKLDANLRRPTDRLFDIEQSLITDVAFSIKSYLSSSSRLTFMPSLYMRLMWGYDGNNMWYNNIAGGAMAGRYLDHQIPFVGMSGTFMLGPAAVACGLDARYRIFDKTYISLYLNMLTHCKRDDLNNIFTSFDATTSYFALAASLGYKSKIGPIMLMAGANSYYRELNAYLSVGFDF